MLAFSSLGTLRVHTLSLADLDIIKMFMLNSAVHDFFLLINAKCQQYQRAVGATLTLYRRRCDVIMSHRR